MSKTELDANWIEIGKVGYLCFFFLDCMVSWVNMVVCQIIGIRFLFFLFLLFLFIFLKCFNSLEFYILYRLDEVKFKRRHFYSEFVYDPFLIGFGFCCRYRIFIATNSDWKCLCSNFTFIYSIFYSSYY